jgi:predicted transcriptional regulator
MLPSQKDILTYQQLLLDSVNRGIADAESGNVYTTEELKKELDERRMRSECLKLIANK